MDTRKPDIFDRLMHLPVLNIFEPFYKKHKEMLLYLFFGGLTFVISVITYAFFNVSLGMNELVANIFSWILAVLFAFFTNRIWVFDGKTNGSFRVYHKTGIWKHGGKNCSPDHCDRIELCDQ